MKEYRYVVAVSGWMGKAGTDRFGNNISQLNQLLAEGWTPIRESAMGGVIV